MPSPEATANADAREDLGKLLTAAVDKATADAAVGFQAGVRPLTAASREAGAARQSTRKRRQPDTEPATPAAAAAPATPAPATPAQQGARGNGSGTGRGQGVSGVAAPRWPLMVRRRRSPRRHATATPYVAAVQCGQPPALLQRLPLEGVLALTPGAEIELHVPAGPEQDRFRQVILSSDEQIRDHSYERVSARGVKRGKMVHGGSANTVLRFHATVCGTNQGAEFLQGGVDRQNALRLYRQGNGILVSLTEFPRQPRYTIKWANIAPLHPHPFDFEVWHARAITAAWMYDKGP